MVDSIWYLCLTLIILLLGIFVKDKKLAITFIGITTIGISGITVYNNMVYVMDLELQGNWLYPILFLISVILLMILVVVNQKRDTKK